jgi:hypothetical protein
MKFNATIELSDLQLRTIIEDYLEKQGIKNVSDPDIHFVIEEVERGDQRDSWKEYELTKVLIKNIRLGNE